MNEEELKKGCGNTFEREDKYYLNKIVIGKCGSQIGLCPTCQARLEGFQKGKLEQKKEELRFLLNIQNWFDTATGQAYEVNERIKQLQKEIKVSGDSLTEFWDNPEDDRWDKEEEKQDE